MARVVQCFRREHEFLEFLLWPFKYIVNNVVCLSRSKYSPVITIV